MTMRRAASPVVALIVLLALTAPALADHPAGGATRDAMLLALPVDDSDSCWDTYVSDVDASWGLAFQSPVGDCGGRDFGPHFVMREHTADGTWSVTRVIADREYDGHLGQCPFDGQPRVPSSIAEDFALCSTPVTCGHRGETIGWVREDLIATYAASAYPRYYAGEYAPTEWELGHMMCADLTGDGDREMVARFICCTGGALTPWGIYKHDNRGRWTRAYAQVRDNVYPFERRGRTIWTRRVYRYEGAFTHLVQNRVVRWERGRFRSSLGRVYDLCKRGRCNRP